MFFSQFLNYQKAFANEEYIYLKIHLRCNKKKENKIYQVMVVKIHLYK